VYSENAWHLFVTCPVAIETWKSLGLWDVIENHVMTVVGMFDLFFIVSNQLSKVKRSM
jgi:hypothetical protein